MARKAILLAALVALASPAALRAQNQNLALLIPDLYGPSGLKVDSKACLLYTSPSPRDRQKSRMPSSA